MSQLSADFLSRWTCHFDYPYDHRTTVEEIESLPAQATHVFVGARRPNGSILGACGRREEVLRRTTSRSRPCWVEPMEKVEVTSDVAASSVKCCAIWSYEWYCVESQLTPVASSL